MSQRPDALLLDVMGTLVHDPFYDEMPAYLGMSLEELLAAKHPTAWVEFELGEIDEETLFERFFRDGRALDGAALKAHMARSYRLLDGVEPLLRDLRERGVPMHVLSNYSDWWRDVEAGTELSRFVSWSFVSCDLGLRKPDPEIYLCAARRLGLAPERCLFVDDKQRNVAAARRVGMEAVRFEGAEGLRRELERRGVL